jgi:hypothetical protein
MEESTERVRKVPAVSELAGLGSEDPQPTAKTLTTTVAELHAAAFKAAARRVLDGLDGFVSLRVTATGSVFPVCIVRFIGISFIGSV